MIVCPVCEHAQAQGAECEVCGKRLASGVAAALAVPAVEGLEPTLHGAVEAAPDHVDGLEPTSREAVPPVPADVTPDLQPTRSAPVDVEVEATPDIERTSEEHPGDAPTALPAFVTCRYCRTPAMPGERICARCGMRLPVVDDAGAPADEPRVTRTCSCGTTVRLDAPLCPSCGARLR